jgi:PrcB C-terminal
MRHLVLALCLTTLGACAARPPADGPQPLMPLAQANYSGAKAAQREVLRSAAAWQKAWDGLQQQRRIAPPVDFERQMVLFAALGERRTGGYAIEVVRAEVVEGTLVVHLRETAPKPGALATMALTAPFHAVAVPRNDLPVRWFTLP